MVRLRKCHSPASTTSTPSSARFSWSSNCSSRTSPTESQVDAFPVSPDDNEVQRLVKARERLARRELELRQVVRYCNSEMDFIRRKLCQDLEVMEVIKEEVEKAGTGSMRDQLETDFYIEYVDYVATLVKQKEIVDRLQEQKLAALRALEGISWSDRVLESREKESSM